MRPKPYLLGNHNKYYDFRIYNLVVSQTEFPKLAANKVEYCASLACFFSFFNIKVLLKENYGIIIFKLHIGSVKYFSETT